MHATSVYTNEQLSIEYDMIREPVLFVFLYHQRNDWRWLVEWPFTDDGFTAYKLHYIESMGAPQWRGYRLFAGRICEYW